MTLINKTVNEVDFDSSISSEKVLECVLVAKCSTSRARVNKITLRGESRKHPQIVDTPVFMPVGTQGSMKGITTEQMKNMFDCRLFLGNTYHLGHRPGPKIMTSAGGLHKFMKWDGGLLTDSGGFQMVSLAELSYVTEEGVNFTSPHDKTEMLLTPEHSMQIQNAIGADIMMQLDDVVSSLISGPRVEEALYRSVRWLDRCILAHQRRKDQTLFAIVQGGLSEELRNKCLEMMLQRQHMVGGFAIGGLSGGEEKDAFWRMVNMCCVEGALPPNKPRYVMGVGYSLDILVCVALGADMFDCVYPTRTGRFGCALVPWGNVYLSNTQYKYDFTPVDPNCSCVTCQKYTRAYLFSINGTPTFASLISVHNVAYMLNYMRDMRTAIEQDQFPQFCRSFFTRQFPNASDYPAWAIEALATVNIVI